MEPLARLLPSPALLQLEAVEFDEAAHRIGLCLISFQPNAACPCCGVPSDRIHSRYVRSVLDLPWADWSVCLHLTVRKFRCTNDDCPRKIFCERLPAVVAPWGRSTKRLQQRQRHIGLALGGNAGHRLSRHLKHETSRNTLLRLIRSTPERLLSTPKILGVDDWAKRKGQDYGTILVDLEARRVIELLDDREAQTLADWLAAHPGVEIIARDRATAYSDGASRGAPSALQVADRFHLVHNLIDVLQQVFERHRTLLRLPAPEPGPPQPGPPPIAPPASDQEEDTLEATPCPTLAPALTQKGQLRLAHYEQARALNEQGWTRSAIARHLGIQRHTVRRYIEAETFPDRRHSGSRSKLDPYKPYLIARWNAGCRTGKDLYEEILAQGYRGGRSIVYAYITRLRQAQGLPPRSRMHQPGDAVRDEEARRMTPRQAAFLVLRRPEKLREKDHQMLAHVQQAHPEFAEALSLGRDYLHLVREQMVEELDVWLERAASSTLVAFRRFAKSLRRDYAAVKAALSHRWSTSPVEGHINKLKMIKRQMYGRAKLGLLSKRVLYAA